ncbi:MAG: sigma-54 dependent transcriptional regulator [Myxococcota bacterium]|nr:sigma-54 dependent transcriptional regulator [Myxococcota bacterium]
MALLFIDDDTTGRKVSTYNLTRLGLEIDEAVDGADGLRQFDPDRHEVVITDLKMPGIDGMAVLSTIFKRAPQTPVVVITAFGSVGGAVEAMQAGAWDFIEKPFSRDRLAITVRRALETSRLRRDNRRLRVGKVERPIVAVSEAMTALLTLTDRVASSEATVLITGESGTGKELLARRIHARSPRAEGPFVPLSCAAIPEALLEDELFGHARGAFTGASTARQGRFRAASGGTLFLDEIGELPLGLQGRLLRVLQEGMVDVIGQDRPEALNVRVVAATNRDLEARVEDGVFREDLYYRLNVVRLHAPPLRERRTDIPALTRHFLDTLGGHRLALPDSVAAGLTSMPWRGNVRELRNACERMAILASDGTVRLADLPTLGLSAASSRWLDLLPEGLSLIDLERQVIAYVLSRCEDNVSKAARRLGVPRHILAYRMEKYGLKRVD